MKQEDKELLLKDLSARLPYGVKVSIPCIFISCERLEGIHRGRGVSESGDWADIEQIKPYLRPLSSMTKEERMDWREYMTDIEDSCYDLINERLAIMQDWLNAHHFDYRGLIPLGLALEAPKGMY